MAHRKAACPSKQSPDGSPTAKKGNRRSASVRAPKSGRAVVCQRRLIAVYVSGAPAWLRKSTAKSGAEWRPEPPAGVHSIKPPRQQRS